MRDPRRLETVCEALLARGYELGRADRHAVATPPDETDAIGGPGELRVVPTPTTPRGLLKTIGRALETDRTAGRFVSVGEMKANAYQPVPVPLVPERLLGDAHLPEAWALATVENGRVKRVEGA